jgi:Predicted membrane protein (DUF2254)
MITWRKWGGDANGVVRLIFPMPTWEDYLTLALDEIRQYGVTSVQVMRRLRSVLVGLADSLSSTERANAVRRYLEHLDLVIEHSTLDAKDRLMAHQEDRQGLGLTRGRAAQFKLLPLGVPRPRRSSRHSGDRIFERRVLKLVSIAALHHLFQPRVRSGSQNEPARAGTRCARSGASGDGSAKQLIDRR